MSQTPNINQETFDTLKRIIKEAKIGMLATISQQGKIVARPMQLQEVEFDGDLWFLTRTDTDKYDEIKNNDIVNVIIADKSYASIAGTAELVNDLEKKKDFWSKGYEVFLGLPDYKDPRIVLIKVVIDTAEYWDTGATTKSIVNFVKKIIGNEDELPKGKNINEKLDL